MSGRLVLGQVVRLSRVGLDGTPVAKLKVTEQKMDKFFKAFWPSESFVWAEAGGTEALHEGDTVLARPADKPLTKEVKHRVTRVVYPAGRVVDPLTGFAVTASVEHKPRAELRSKLIQDALKAHAEQAKLANMYK